MTTTALTLKIQVSSHTETHAVLPGSSSSSASSPTSPLTLFPQEVIEPEVLKLLQQPTFVQKMEGKPWIRYMKFMDGDSPFIAEAHAKLLTANELVLGYQATIENPSPCASKSTCLSEPTWFKIRIVATLVFGIAAAILTAIPAENIVGDDLIWLVIAIRVVLTVGSLGTGAYAYYTNREVRIATDNLKTKNIEIQTLFDEEASRVETMAKELLLDWVSATPCHGRPKMLEKVKHRHIFTPEQLLNKEAHKQAIKQMISAHWRTSHQRITGQLSELIDDTTRAQPIIRSYPDAVLAILADCNMGSHGIEGLRKNMRTMSNNTMIGVLHNYRWVQERRLQELLDPKLFLAPNLSQRTRAASVADSKNGKDPGKDKGDHKSKEAPKAESTSGATSSARRKPPRLPPLDTGQKPKKS
jgi:hypothetical protein